MSASPSTSDVVLSRSKQRSGQERPKCTAATVSLFDDLVGQRKQLIGYS